MKAASLCIASLVAWSVFSVGASAQPILNRVEQFLREQVGTPQKLVPSNAVANEPGYLGLKVDDRQDLGRGVRITAVTPGAPASQAGLLVGDLVTGVDGRPVRLMGDLSQALESKRAGDKVAVSVDRQNQQRQFEVTLGLKPESRLIDRTAAELPAPSAAGQGPTLNLPPPPRPRLGVQTIPVTLDTQRQNNLTSLQGAVVQSVTAGSPAERAGIRAGTVITAVDRQPIDTPEALAAAIARAGDQVELTVIELGVPKHQRVALVAPLPGAGEPKLELRGRPIDAPAEPTRTEAPALARANDDSSHVEQLEARIRELESRIEKLEAALGDKLEAPK
jgi:S1-C subfamily serine protease